MEEGLQMLKFTKIVIGTILFCLVLVLSKKMKKVATKMISDVNEDLSNVLDHTRMIDSPIFIVDKNDDSNEKVLLVPTVHKTREQFEKDLLKMFDADKVKDKELNLSLPADYSLYIYDGVSLEQKFSHFKFKTDSNLFFNQFRMPEFFTADEIADKLCKQSDRNRSYIDKYLVDFCNLLGFIILAIIFF